MPALWQPLAIFRMEAGILAERKLSALAGMVDGADDNRASHGLALQRNFQFRTGFLEWQALDFRKPGNHIATLSAAPHTGPSAAQIMLLAKFTTFLFRKNRESVSGRRRADKANAIPHPWHR